MSLAVEDGAEELALLGFSMGGAVAIAAADHPRVTTVIGLAPWIPDRLDVATLDGRRVTIVHGSLDRWLPGIPGRQPEELAARLRADPPARDRRHVHDRLRRNPRLAVRSRRGGTIPLPRAGHWAKLVSAELRRFESGDARRRGRHRRSSRAPVARGAVPAVGRPSDRAGPLRWDGQRAVPARRRHGRATPSHRLGCRGCGQRARVAATAGAASAGGHSRPAREGDPRARAIRGLGRCTRGSAARTRPSTASPTQIPSRETWHSSSRRCTGSTLRTGRLPVAAYRW